MGSTLNNDHTKKRFFVLFFRSAKYRSQVQKRSKAQKRRKNEVINFLYLTISKISTKNLKIMNPINEIMHL